MKWFRKQVQNSDNFVDLQVPWDAANYIAIDFEATGLDLRNDDVISYGTVPVRQARIVVGEQQYSLVRPTRPVPPESSKFHVIRNQDLADAPTAAEAARQLMSLLHGNVMIAHASWVESAFLQRLFGHHGAVFDAPVVDTASLARFLDMRPRIGTHEPHLETLATELQVPVHDPHHALGDALTTAQVFLVLAHRVAATHAQPLTVGHLVNISRQYALLRG